MPLNKYLQSTIIIIWSNSLLPKAYSLFSHATILTVVLLLGVAFVTRLFLYGRVMMW